MPDPNEKIAVRLSIYNQEFSLIVSSAQAAADLESAADEVDQLMSTIARSGNMDATRVAILACLHLQDRVRSLEEDFAQMKTGIETQSRKLSDLLDEVVPD